MVPGYRGEPSRATQSGWEEVEECSGWGGGFWEGDGEETGVNEPGADETD